MRVVLQRVKKARVSVEEKTIGEIGVGIVILLGVGREDSIAQAQWLAEKISSLRIFEDKEEKMNLSLLDVKAEIMVIPQFTLYGDCRKGRRPDFFSAAPPDKAKELYLTFIDLLKKTGLRVSEGEFQAKMILEIHNDGPVTLILEK